MKPVHYCIGEYVASHGKCPSGRGSWAFIVADSFNRNEIETVFAPGCLTLTEAKNWMRNYLHQNWAGEVTCRDVYVKIAP